MIYLFENCSWIQLDQPLLEHETFISPLKGKGVMPKLQLIK